MSFYLRTLEVHHLKLVASAALDFLRAGKPRMWTVLVGENGRCKTTLLQAIAMAAVGHARANQLADVPSLPDIRSDALTDIVGHFDSGPAPGAATNSDDPRSQVMSTVAMHAGDSLLSGASLYVAGSVPHSIDPMAEVRAKNVVGWFIGGYGINRSLPRPYESALPSDPLLNQLGSLFGRGPIIGTGFVDILEDSQGFARVLREALIDGGLLPDVDALDLRGRGGVRTADDLLASHSFTWHDGNGGLRIPATWLSQGYQATIAWVADLLGQATLEAGRVIPPSEVKGIVLIDEIDLHLHPRWQVKLIPALKKVFPKVQFIVTTHSPMVLPGLERDEIILLSLDEHGNVVARQPEETPQLMTGTQLYRDFFGVDGLFPNELGEDMNRLGYLIANPFRSDDDDKEIVRLRSKLGEHHLDPGWEPVPRRSQP